MLSIAAKNAQHAMHSRDLLNFTDYSGEEILALLNLAADLKGKRARGERTAYLAGKTLAMIFEKVSTRTRVSFEVGMYELGGHALYLSDTATQIGRGEPICDTANVLSRFVHGIMIRTFSQKNIEELAHFASIPVINGLTDDHHPCQILADLMTIKEHKGRLQGLTLAYVGDGNNIAHSLLQALPLVGMNIRIASPFGYEPKADILQEAQRNARLSRTEVMLTDDPYKAVKGADLVYTDVWASMGQETEADARQRSFAPYQVDALLMAAASKDTLFMHDLPAHRGEEVAADVIDGPQSIIYDQAENRLHAQKAVLVALMGDQFISL
jgi:ornithine carbamoyltransferase